MKGDASQTEGNVMGEQLEEVLGTWETVTKEHSLKWYTERLRVPGGWLYRSAALYDAEEGGNAMALCFVPLSNERL